MRLLKKVNKLPKVKHTRPLPPAYREPAAPVSYLEQRVQDDDARTDMTQPAAATCAAFGPRPRTAIVPAFPAPALAQG